MRASLFWREKLEHQERGKEHQERGTGDQGQEQEFRGDEREERSTEYQRRVRNATSRTRRRGLLEEDEETITNDERGGRSGPNERGRKSGFNEREGRSGRRTDHQQRPRGVRRVRKAENDEEGLIIKGEEKSKNRSFDETSEGESIISIPCHLHTFWVKGGSASSHLEQVHFISPSLHLHPGLA